MKKDYVLAGGHAAANEADFVADFWTERWESRVELPRPESVFGREELRLMKPHLHQLPRGSRILDAGCGMGEWTVCLTRLGFEVVGLDLSESTVSRLQAAYPQSEFVAGDIRDTRFADGSFAALFSWGAFEHFELGPADCIREARRLLRPTGVLFLTVPYQNWRHIMREASPHYRWDETLPFWRDAAQDGAFRFYQWRFTPTDLRQQLEMQGFEVLTLQPVHAAEGLHRALELDLHLRPGSATFRRARRLLSPIASARFLGHMLFAAARPCRQSREARPETLSSTHSVKELDG
jgi:SAM-dependent methyltransferase